MEKVEIAIIIGVVIGVFKYGYRITLIILFWIMSEKSIKKVKTVLPFIFNKSVSKK